METKKSEQIYFQCGCTLLDKVVGGNKDIFGAPAGKFINIVGDKSAGKTFLSNEFIAWAHYNFGKKFKWVYDDCESGYSFDTESMYGFEIMPQDESKRVHSENVEECFCNISKFANELGKNECGIYVVDSLDGLTSYEDDERAEERKKQFDEGKGAKLKTGTYAMSKQKYLSKEFFPQLCSEIEKKNILVIIISQIRENIEPMSFEKYSRSGGKAMDFYAHSVIWLAGAKKILRKDTPIGNVVKAKTTKSKTPRPFRECFFNFLYDYGLDNIGTSIDYLFDLRTDKGELNKKAAAIKWDGDNNFDKKSLKEFLEENDLYERFENSKYYDMDGSDADNMFTFIQSKKDYKSKFNEKFGDTMTRDELIAYIEENNLEDELRTRVDKKWEDFEDSIKSNRKKKYYSKQLESEE
jgi:recombination protein RecA